MKFNFMFDFNFDFESDFESDFERLVTCSENLSFKNLEGALTILCALTQKRTILFSTILFWVSAQSIVKTPSKFLKLGTHRAGDQPLGIFYEKS